jgi:hypothetical protein
MKADASNIEVLEWGNTNAIIEATKGFKPSQKLPGHLSFSIAFDPIDADQQLNFSLTTKYVVFANEVAIWEYKAIIWVTIEREPLIPTMEDLNKFIHNILFFRYTTYFYWQWQSEHPSVDPYAVDIDNLQNGNIFDLTDQIREKLI